jgi:SAM-dependent methyltransferase
MTAHTDLDAREGLEQQTVAGYLACDDPGRPAEQRRYQLLPGHAEMLLDADSRYHAAPVAVILAGVATVLPQVLAAYRTGGGVSYAAYGQQLRRGIAALNRPMFLHELASTWLPAMPDLDRRLRAGPPARVLDLGCGLGASSIALARAYPNAQVLGVDLDEASVTEARVAAAEAGVADRISFVVGDAAQVAAEGPFDLITIFEALHDMGDPEGALRAARALLADDGQVLVADERWPTPSPRRATWWSGSCTAGASCTACPQPWPSAQWRPPARSCAPPPSPAGPPRRASPGSRSCPSTTPSGASTACTTE